MSMPGAAGRILAAVFLAFFVLPPCREARGGDAGQEAIPNVVILTFSGVRNSESIDDPSHQYIPELWGRMFREGTVYTDLVNLNLQFHMPVFHAINSGMHYPFLASSLKAPSIFQYARKQYSLPNTKTWSMGHWVNADYALRTAEYPEDTYPCAFGIINLEMSGELEQILTKQEAAFWESYCKLLETNPEKWPNWDSMGEMQYLFFKKIMREFKPKLVHYILNDVESAHSDTFARYVLALKRCDQRIAEVWQMLQADPFYKDTTYLFVVVDHERNRYYMDHHENAYPNPARVWMYVYGPRVKKGQVIERPVYHADIFATVAYLMGLKTHAPEGTVLSDCLQ